MATTIETFRLALDEHTLRKRRERLFNPITAPYVELHASLFGTYIPAPPIPLPPPPPQGKLFTPFTPPQQPPVTPNPPPSKSREERGKGRLERRGQYSGQSSKELPMSPSESKPKFPSFNISPSNLLPPIMRNRTKVEPYTPT